MKAVDAAGNTSCLFTFTSHDRRSMFIMFISAGKTALHLAAGGGHSLCAQRLLQVPEHNFPITMTGRETSEEPLWNVAVLT